MAKRKKPWWLLLALPFLLGAGGDANAADDDGDDDDLPPPPPPDDCPVGTVRNAETGECDPIVVIDVDPTLLPCPVGLTRNPETGECEGATFVPGALEPDPPTDPGIADLDELENDYPGEARFYQVKQGDTFEGSGGVSTRLASSALYAAARTVGQLDHAAALAWASARNGPTAQAAVTRWIACTPHNDERYATYGFGPQARPGMQGRAIRMVPQHANNRSRYAASLPPIRNIRIGTPPGPKPANQRATGVDPELRSFEYLWLTPFDHVLLWQSDGENFSPSEETWSDGSGKIHPPPAFQALGLQDLSGAGLGRVWGCAPFTEELEEA